MNKELNELDFPNNVLYSIDHKWAKQEGDIIRVGITDFVQDQIGHFVSVELPEINKRFDRNEIFGTLESVNAIRNLYMPISGEVLKINEMLFNEPELLNKDPYKKGWIIVIKPFDLNDYVALDSREEYLRMIMLSP